MIASPKFEACHRRRVRSISPEEEHLDAAETLAQLPVAASCGTPAIETAAAAVPLLTSVVEEQLTSPRPAVGGAADGCGVATQAVAPCDAAAGQKTPLDDSQKQTNIIAPLVPQALFAAPCSAPRLASEHVRDLLSAVLDGERAATTAGEQHKMPADGAAL